jgi:hypothetical protein
MRFDQCPQAAPEYSVIVSDKNAHGTHG